MSDINLPTLYGHNSSRGVFTDAANDNRFERLPATFSRPLFNGYNPSGRAEDFRVVSWSDWVPNHGWRHGVGFLFERWPSGAQTRMDQTPEVVLWLHANLPTRDEADALGASLARNNVFSMIREKVAAGDNNPICSRPEHLPFARPEYWRDRPAGGPGPAQSVK